MKPGRLLLIALVCSVGWVGCKKKPPAEGPAPDPEGAARVVNPDSAARADSLAEARRLATVREAERARAEEALSERVYFDFDSNLLSSEAQEKLRVKAEIMRMNPSVRLRVEGHTDERGTTEYNLALGQRRAEAARAFLVRHGVSPERISTVSYGKERPIADGSNESAWAMNRRDDFAIIGGELRAVPGETR
ncbi:MAG: peptidoglycan-associated lipoprotein Pal [Longimicrobiaceae bacterium]